MPDILSILLIAFIALILIGPRRLPQSVEALWLAVTDYGRVQRGLPPLGSIENARIVWAREKNSVYGFVQILYQVTVHLEELRGRLLVSIIVLAVTFLVAFFFSQQLLAFVVKPVSGAPFKPASQSAVNEYVLARDVQVIVPVPSATGPVSTTVTLPAGTSIPLALPSPKPVFLHPTELFSTYIKISGLAAVGLSLPVLLWQVLMFLRGPKYEVARLSRRQWEERKKSLSPDALLVAEEERKAVYGGLTATEVRPLYILVPLAGLFFVGGVLFTYFLILPSALEFLFGLGGDLVQPLPALDDYIGFSIALIFWVAISFELPLVMFFLARFHLITSRQFIKQWRYAVVIIVVIAAVITPTTDAFNMSLVAAPMLGLYIIGIIMSRFAEVGARTAQNSILKQRSNQP